MTEWSDVQAEPIEAGEYPAVVEAAQLTTSRAGAPCIRWDFRLESGRIVSRTTPRRGAGAPYTYEVAQALGLGRSFKLSAAAGHPCRVVLKQDGPWISVEQVLPPR